MALCDNREVLTGCKSGSPSSEEPFEAMTDTLKESEDRLRPLEPQVVMTTRETKRYSQLSMASSVSTSRRFKAKSQSLDPEELKSCHSSEKADSMPTTPTGQYTRRPAAPDDTINKKWLEMYSANQTRTDPIAQKLLNKKLGISNKKAPRRSQSDKLYGGQRSRVSSNESSFSNPGYVSASKPPSIIGDFSEGEEIMDIGAQSLQKSYSETNLVDIGKPSSSGTAGSEHSEPASVSKAESYLDLPRDTNSSAGMTDSIEVNVVQNQTSRKDAEPDLSTQTNIVLNYPMSSNLSPGVVKVGGDDSNMRQIVINIVTNPPTSQDESKQSLDRQNVPYLAPQTVIQNQPSLQSLRESTQSLNLQPPPFQNEKLPLCEDAKKNKKKKKKLCCLCCICTCGPNEGSDDEA